MWTKRNDHAPKVNVLISMCPKREVLRNILIGPVLCLLLSSSSLPPKKSLKNYYKKHFSAMGPCLFPTRAPLLPLPLQNRWTLLVDNVGLKICLLKNSNSMELTFFLMLVKPITYFKWPWDDFMVHGVNSP